MKVSNCSNKLTFKARLNTSNITQHRERWDNISDIFYKITDEKHPFTTLYLSDEKEGLSIENFVDLNFYCGIKKDAYEHLMKFRDDIIAKKLAKIMYLGIRAKEVENDCDAIARKMNLNEDFYDNFYDNVKRNLKRENAEILNKDSVFSDCDFVC